MSRSISDTACKLRQNDIYELCVHLSYRAGLRIELICVGFRDPFGN